MSETKCVGQKIEDAEFVKTFYLNFDKLSEKEQGVAIDVTKAFLDESRKRKPVNAEYVSTFYPSFNTLEEKEQRVAVEVIEALVKKMRKERVR